MAAHGKKLADGVMDNPHGTDHPAKAAGAGPCDSAYL
jgi:hypothetical protein